MKQTNFAEFSITLAPNLLNFAHAESFFSAVAYPVAGKGKGKRSSQAAKGGGHRSGGGSSIAAAVADAPSLSSNDPDPGNPLPAFVAPKFAPTSLVGLHFEGPDLRITMEQQTFSHHFLSMTENHSVISCFTLHKLF